MATPQSPARTHLLAALGVVAVLAISTWLRWPGFTQGGFASHDVGGILYNAMILRDGELPYVADIELKSPGSFYLAWALAGDGTDIARFQVWANLWGLLGVLAVAVVAWRHFGPPAAPVAAAILAACDANLDSMDANYVTWAQLPAVLAFAWAAEAVRHVGRPRAIGLVVAGMLAGVTILIKQPTGVVSLALAVCCTPWIWSRTWSTTARDQAALVAGGVLVHLPLVLHYASAGALGELVDAYPINRWGIGYVAGGGRQAEWPAVIEGALATVFFLALPLVLAAFAAWPRRGAAIPERAVALRVPLLVWAGCMLAAAWVGLRFYKGYFLGVAPPLALLGAAPWGLLGAHAGVRAPLRALLLVPVAVVFGRQCVIDWATRVDRARPHDEGARVVAAHLQRELPPGERIWIWGWHLWDVYALADRRSASRIYKSLGLLTPPNDDTWRHPATPLVFVDGEYAALLLEDLERTPPGYIVLGSTVPHRQFAALRKLLQRDYERDTTVRLGRLEMWRRRLGP